MMKSLFLMLLFSLLGRLVYANSIDTLTFSENYVGTHNFQTPSDASRPSSVSNARGGVFVVNYEWPVDKPDEWKQMVSESFRRAADLWDQYLDGDSIKIRVVFSESQEDDIITTLLFVTQEDVGISYPLPLYRRNGGVFIIDNDKDALVSIKSTEDWCIGVGDDVTGKNLTLAFCRCIAATMGFGSSFNIVRRGQITRNTSAYTAFDRLIVNGNGVWLSDIPLSSGSVASSVINSYTQSVDAPVYVSQTDSAYKLYAPNPFVKNVSLRYLDTNSSLMSYPQQDSLDLAVDNVVDGIMRQLGWERTPAINLEILWQDLYSYGFASAYDANTFYLNPSNYNISNRQWTCTLPLANGGSELYATSTDATLTIPAIADESCYEHTPDGEIKAVIEFSGIIDGNPVEASLTQRLRLKPHITWVSPEFSFTPHAELDDFYTIDLDVKYEGCYYLYVTVKPRYSMAVSAYYFNTPYMTHVQLPNVDMWAGAKVTIKAVNAYGADTKVYNLAAPSASREFDYTSVLDLRKSPGETIMAYDLLGNCVCSPADSRSLQKLKRGRVYILKVSDDTGRQRTLKYRIP